MEYSIEDVTKLAKVSVRTLHYYDEIGLLKPAVRMENGRRFYAEEQVLRLMDIIFFKKIGFSLKKIKSLLILGNKDKRALMVAKKEFLQKEGERIKDLIETINLTLDFYYKGENKNYEQIIKQFEHFQGLVEENKQRFLREFGSLESEEGKKLQNMSVQEQIEYFTNKFKNIDVQRYGKKMTLIFKQLVQAVDDSLNESSKEVQMLMDDFFKISSMAQPMSKKEWLRMGVTIGENKEIYLAYAKMHPKLPEFLIKAIKVYGETLK